MPTPPTGSPRRRRRSEGPCSLEGCSTKSACEVMPAHDEYDWLACANHFDTFSALTSPDDYTVRFF